MLKSLDKSTDVALCRRMRPQRIIFCSSILAALFLFSSCGYVHVGQLPAPMPTVMRDDSRPSENAELLHEKMQLQRELALSRAQGEALRSALQNRAADGDTSRRLVDRLNETTRELTALRATYARLQSEREQASGPATEMKALQARLGATEEKLATALHNYTELQEEVARLRRDLVRSRTENLALTQQVKAVTTQNQHAQAALAQLNIDLLAQRDARFRAEQDAHALRTELNSIAPDSSILAQQRIGTAGETHSLATEHTADAAALRQQIDLLHAKVSALTEEGSQLKSQLAQFKPSSGSSAAPAIASAGTSAITTITMHPAAATTAHIVRNEGGGQTRFHVVAGGDTLARISTRYYGTPGRWNEILAANRDILGETNTLVIGRTLRIP